MRAASFVEALKELSASVEGNNVEKIAISGSFKRLLNVNFVRVMAKLLNSDYLISADVTVKVRSHYG
jgi:hypothetical protein